MIDGRPAQYGISLKHLRELMELRGRDAIAKLNECGGVQELCRKLYTSPSEGSAGNILRNRACQRWETVILRLDRNRSLAGAF